MKIQVKRALPEPSDESAVSHQLNRAAFRLPLMQARVLQVVLSQLRPNDTTFPTVEMAVGDVLRALGLEDTKFYRDQLRAQTKALRSQTMDVDTGDGWAQFGFVDRAEWIKSRDVLQVRPSQDIAEFVLDLKGLFSMISNEEFARLTSEYAIRLFQLLSSWRDKAGKDGNKPGCWWWESDFATLRHLMKVPGDAYMGSDGTSNFKVKVIENPLKEINAADLGLVVTTEYRKRGRSIVGVRFNCKLTSKAKPIGKVPDEIEKGVLKLRETKRWKEIFHALQAQPELPGMPNVDRDTRRQMDENKADKDLAKELAEAPPAKGVKKPATRG
jgi:plasmid replication initiation protein